MFRTIQCCLLLLIAGLTASGAAAQNSGSSPPVHECTNGCYIVTCQGNVCTMSYCSNGRCNFATSFTRPQEQQKSGLLSGSAPRSTLLSSHPVDSGIAVDGPVGVNTCSATTCSQFVLHQGGIIAAGSSENPRNVLRRTLESQQQRR